MTEQEIWKPVLGFEGYYEVSNLGRVRSLTRYIYQPMGSNRIIVPHRYDGKVLVPQLCSEYLCVPLLKNGMVSHCCVHRLVATAFLPNPDNLPTVNHINENRLDNRVENLEWCSYSYNLRYGNRSAKFVETIRKNGRGRWTPKYVLQFSKEHELLAVYPSLIEACRRVGVDRKTLWKVINKPNRTTRKCYWETLEAPELPEQYQEYLAR